MIASLRQILLRAKVSSDVVLAVVAAAILGAMMVPLPAWLLDVGLALNLAAAVTLLVAALYARDPLKVASFPTLLLLTTLFRLAMNVSSTRLALADGHAGAVIEAFGEFVVRGDYIVGGVVFAILTLVQFLVVAKGAERVAEVSARFTLDAMPGKQMAIDADLRAGAIDQSEARRRRRALERESQMFGAMDGAMKFVKGDVIAGLIIVLVNLLAGTAVGVFQHGLAFSEALATYALIAIGDGLVSQLPSLCIAVAAGLVVTRVASEEAGASLGDEIGAQFFGHPKALFVVSGVCGALALMPGMPHGTFWVLAAALAGLGLLWRKVQAGRPPVEEDVGQPEATPGNSPGPQVSGTAPLLVALSADLLPLSEESDSRCIRRDLDRVRDQFYWDLGVQLPPIAVRSNVGGMGRGEYALLLDEVPVARGNAGLELVQVPASADELRTQGLSAEPTVDATSGGPAAFVPVGQRARAEALGFNVLGPGAVIRQHLLQLLRRRAADFLGLQEVQSLLEGFEPQAPVLVKEALAKVPMPLLADVLRRLVQEEVSIRNLRVILEALVAPTAEGDARALADRCRQALHRYLSHKYAPNGPLYAYLVDPAVEQDLRAAPGGGLSPDRVSQILEGVRRIASAGRAVLLTGPDVRRPLRALCEGGFPDVAVLTYSELAPDLQVRPLGKLTAAAPLR